MPPGAVGDTAEESGRVDDLELASGPDLEVHSVEADTVEEYEAESGITGDELAQALSEVEAQAGTQPRTFGNIGKLVLSVQRAVPKSLLVGSYVRVPSPAGSNLGAASILSGMNLQLMASAIAKASGPGASLTPDDLARAGISIPWSQIDNMTYAYGRQSCARPGSTHVPVPAAHAPKLVQRIGGKAASYSLCVAPTFVRRTGAKQSVRTYFDERVSPPKVVAVRRVTVTGATTTVVDVPRGVF